MIRTEPLVSVLTPVYNGEAYLAKCIESVLSQRYQNWEYMIVNNCSTDNTIDIAKRYEKIDRRIKVISNSNFVNVIENHNIAFKIISNTSKYCKVVSADDFIYPECLMNLVALAEQNSSIGIVGAYSILGYGIRRLGFPLDKSVFDGRQVCRNFLLGSLDVFCSPTTVLYRSALVRSFEDFYPGTSPNADIAACLICLQSCDFGFVHQILSFERIHNEAVSTKLEELNSFFVDRLEFVVEYGSIYLTHKEIENRMRELLSHYFEFLASSIFKLRNNEFWIYHKKRLKKIGYSILSLRLLFAICAKIIDLLFNPKKTIEKIIKRLLGQRFQTKKQRWL